jgi:hypothetical protein
MTIAEFKAWFAGFVQGTGETPTAEQWNGIKKKIVAIEEKKAPVDPRSVPELRWNRPRVKPGGVREASPH